MSFTGYPNVFSSLIFSQFNDENENDFSKSNDGISLKSQRSPKSFGKAGISPTSEAPSETSGDQASSNVSDIEQDEIAEGSSSK